MIITRQVCDFCQLTSTEVVASAVEISFNGRTIVVDLCDNHRDKLWSGDLELAFQVGRRPDGKPQRKNTSTPAGPQAVNPIDPLTCSVCGKVAKSPRGLKAHQSRQNHHLSDGSHTSAA